jgi:hypothetical protein
VDGLKGFPEAVEAVVPGHGRRAPVVHQVRSSPRYVTYTDRKKVSPTQGRRRRHRRRRRRSPNWPPSDPFLALPADLRRIVYTTAASRTSTANPQGDQDPPATSPTNKPPPAHPLAIHRAKTASKRPYRWPSALLKIHFADRLPD